MARLAQAGVIESHTEGNTVGYSADLSDDIFLNGKKLKDSDFLFYSSAPYSRKKTAIHQFCYGYNGTGSSDSRVNMAKIISPSVTPVSRFVPIVSPEYSGSMTFLDEITYICDGYSITDRKFKDLYNGYMYGGTDSKGEYTDRICFATSWNYKQWVIVPVLVGVYVGCTVSGGNTVFHANVIALKDYFNLSNPETDYPQTHNNGTLAGFSYGFYFAGNLANNTAGVSNAYPQMRDCGLECSFQPFECLCGAYGQDLPFLPVGYANDVFTPEIFPDGLILPRCSNTFLGLGIGFSSAYANNMGNYQNPFTSPIFRIRNRGSGQRNAWGTSSCFHVVGGSEYLDYTALEYQIGKSEGNVELYAQIPTISSQYIDYDFLLEVAGQLGMPIIDSRAEVERFMSAPNVETYWNENGDKIKVPNFDPDTGEVKEGTPDNYGDIPESDPRKRVTEGTNPIEDVGEMDTSDPDTNHYVDKTPLNTPDITAVGKFNKYYALSADDVENLADFLYTNNSSVISDILDGLKLNGENPMNFLISLKMFPFDITEYARVSSSNIHFGNGVDTGVLAYQIDDFTATIPLGECQFRKYFKNFYDYEPYTNAKIYIPYCGEVTVQTAQCVGHTIKVDLIVDLITGACCGVVFCDDIAIAYSEGNISAEIPITGENATQYVSQAMSALPQLINNGAAFAGGDINSGLGLIKGAYDFTHMPTALEKSGSQTPTINFFKPQYCYFVVQSPVLLPTSGYASQVGYACEMTKRLGDLTGFTVCANVENITPPNATAEEITMIKNLLETGVYL